MNEAADLKELPVGAKLRRRLLAGETLIGGYVQSSSPELVEIAGDIGFDYLILSAEDTAHQLPQRITQLYAAAGSGVGTLYRPSKIDASEMRQALDAGASGLNVPNVATRRDAEAIVDAVFYAPKGSRGLNSMSRPVRYGAGYTPDYFETANESVLVTVLIESAEGVENAEEIAAVDGIDVLYVGPTDLALSLGVPGQPFHEKVEEAAEHVLQAARSQNKVAAHVVMNSFDDDELERRLSSGYRMLSVFLDLQIFRLACTRVHTSALEVLRGSSSRPPVE